MRCSALGGGLYRERIVGTHRAVEFPHAPPVRSSCRRGVRGDTRSSRVRAVNNRAPHAATLGLGNCRCCGFYANSLLSNLGLFWIGPCIDFY
ncbi:unnamed protein product [Arctia plantaginis]|uniref:Uncharacterized protein n=1 Tax=Arctia plantaginis TaxID=874455 RepID=A0A8S0ZCW7_ARCPL|nr:unnamed protein product [Arctia plantaginis]